MAGTTGTRFPTRRAPAEGARRTTIEETLLALIGSTLRTRPPAGVGPLKYHGEAPCLSAIKDRQKFRPISRIHAAYR